MPWGDYGNTLLVGYVYPDDNDENIIYIERTGPFVPPVYEWARILLVSDSTKQKIEKSNLKGVEFSKTVFKKIVNIDWTKWDLNDDEPKLYPAGGEPENYIFKRKHSPELASKMEEIWALKLNEETLIGRKRRNVSDNDELFIMENSWTGNDIFCGKGAGHIYFSKNAKTWFEENLQEYANFKSFNSKVALQEEIDFLLEYLQPQTPKVDPFAHLTEQDWKIYQKYLNHAKKFIAKSQSDKTEKSKTTSIKKAIESFKNAEQIRPLGKKEQEILNKLLLTVSYL